VIQITVRGVLFVVLKGRGKAGPTLEIPHMRGKQVCSGGWRGASGQSRKEEGRRVRIKETYRGRGLSMV